MANNTNHQNSKGGKIGQAIGSILTIKKLPLLIIGVILLLILLIVVPLIVLFSNNNGFSSGPISNVGAAEIPPEYIPIYQAAEKTYNVPWNLLAAVHRVETNFGTIQPMISPVGALGHMQFMCRTWVGWSIPGTALGDCDASIDYTDVSLIKQNSGYGLDANGDGKADPFDPYDAIFTAAKYLAANGAANGNIENALYAYNHSMEYVQNVLSYAVSYVTDPGLSPDGAFVIDSNRSDISWPVPCTTYVTSPFGFRVNPISKQVEMHTGVDISETKCYRTSIVSAFDGKVTFAGNAGGYGNVVYVEHGNGMQTRYAHLDGITVRVGQTVEKGQTVGLLGNTGDSTGPHLHFEIRIANTPYDPLKFY